MNFIKTTKSQNYPILLGIYMNHTLLFNLIHILPYCIIHQSMCSSELRATQENLTQLLEPNQRTLTSECLWTYTHEFKYEKYRSLGVKSLIKMIHARVVIFTAKCFSVTFHMTSPLSLDS